MIESKNTYRGWSYSYEFSREGGEEASMLAMKEMIQRAEEEIKAKIQKAGIDLNESPQGPDLFLEDA
jgi:hypothetical protein